MVLAQTNMVFTMQEIQADHKQSLHVGLPAADAGPVHLGNGAAATEAERAELLSYLSRPLPEVPPRYFYDDSGSDLFEQITDLSVYYQTRTEIAILERYSEEIIGFARPAHLVELGSGAGRKIRLLLDAWNKLGTGETCTMLDINALFLNQSIDALSADYPHIGFRGLVGDFNTDMHRLGPGGRRMIVFFAGTIGNLYPQERAAFFANVKGAMKPGDVLLLGIDLVKSKSRLEAAYNDPEGVTAAFNKNILNVLNRRFQADFNVNAFEHRAFYDEENQWIEMRLKAVNPIHVNVKSIGLKLDLRAGQEIRTEISCKFTRESIAASAARSGFRLSKWFSDPEGLFAEVLLQLNEG